MEDSIATNYNGGISWFLGLPKKQKTLKQLPQALTN
jgi:hypothetical protein